MKMLSGPGSSRAFVLAGVVDPGRGQRPRLQLVLYPIFVGRLGGAFLPVQLKFWRGLRRPGIHFIVGRDDLIGVCAQKLAERRDIQSIMSRSEGR